MNSSIPTSDLGPILTEAGIQMCVERPPLCQAKPNLRGTEFRPRHVPYSMDYTRSRQRLISFQCAIIAIFTIFIYDYLLTLNDEVRVFLLPASEVLTRISHRSIIYGESDSASVRDEFQHRLLLTLIRPFAKLPSAILLCVEKIFSENLLSGALIFSYRTGTTLCVHSFSKYLVLIYLIYHDLNEH